MLWQRSGSVAGTVTLTGTWLRTGAGQPRSAASRAAAHQAADSVVRRCPQNGENRPAGCSPSRNAVAGVEASETAWSGGSCRRAPDQGGPGGRGLEREQRAPAGGARRAPARHALAERRHRSPVDDGLDDLGPHGDVQQVDDLRVTACRARRARPRTRGEGVVASHAHEVLVDGRDGDGGRPRAGRRRRARRTGARARAPRRRSQVAPRTSATPAVALRSPRLSALPSPRLSGRLSPRLVTAASTASAWTCPPLREPGSCGAHRGRRERRCSTWFRREGNFGRAARWSCAVGVEGPASTTRAAAASTIASRRAAPRGWRRSVVVTRRP